MGLYPPTWLVYRRDMSHLSFTPMTEILKPCQQGVASLDYVEVSQYAASMASMRGQDTRPGKFCLLRINDSIMMSDTYYEQRTNYDVLRQAKGAVLIGGLGIGMILVPLLKNPAVTKVTVLELHQDVIDLVLPQLAGVEGYEKLEVICCDCRSWQPPKGQKWDTIYWDIWPDITTDNLKEITLLKRRYARRLATGGWQGAWVEHTLRARVKQEARQSRSWRW